ncbi:hypothetical protein [Streptomyces lydicus]|uniref:hypothetical protein n=1 Tax=Streptomyces lydicus TaxID=47763 RepID=UPI000F8F06C7|nr:hypothetical protein [Streptomyces lydicus]
MDRFPDPLVVRQRRGPVPDSLARLADGLADQACRQRLARLTMGPPGHPGLDGAQVVTATDYRPYESPGIPSSPDGDRLCAEFMDALLSDEVTKSIQESGPMAILAVTDAIRQILASPDNPVGDRLAALAAAIPAKGGEAGPIIAEYAARHAMDETQATLMALRDYWGSINTFWLPRGTGEFLDLFGAVFILASASAIDYAGASDDSGAGGREVHVKAATEGTVAVAGRAADLALQETALTCGVMLAKDALRHAPDRLPDPRRYLADAGGAPTPHEYMWARWWDAAMLPYFRLGFGSPPYRMLDDDGAGTFDVSFRCHRIRRAIDNSYRYNEIIGVLTDYAHGETCNEALLAIAAGGVRAVTGYAAACARVVDDVLTCDCGGDGHEEVAETAMGGLAWYLVTPRYGVRAQLHALSATTGDFPRVFSLRTAKPQFGSIARTRLADGETLHGPGWEPLWHEDDTPETHWVDQLAERAARRVVTADTSTATTRACATAAHRAISACATATPDDLPQLAPLWRELFLTAVTHTLDTTTTVDDVVTRLADLTARVWEHVIAGPGIAPDPPGDADTILSIDTYHSVWDSYSLPPRQGIPIRRAFIGTLASSVELSGIGPCGRLIDGIVTVLTPHYQDHVPSQPRLS